MTGRSYTRRGFLGLSAAAVAGVGLSACTGAAPRGGSAHQEPTTNELRVFTYEGDETIHLFKAQIAKFDAQAGTKTTVNSLPGSGAAVYPDKLRTELLGGAGPGRVADLGRPDRRPVRQGQAGARPRARTTRSSAGTARSTPRRSRA